MIRLKIVLKFYILNKGGMDLSGNPTVSICIPNYNYAKFLPECFASLLRQTYQDFEVIFRDNASTDSSYEIALKYRQSFLHCGIPFFLRRNQYNFGSDRNSELCAKESRGRFRLILASDDVLYPTYLEETIAVLEKYPQVSMVMTHRDEINDAGEIIVLPPFYKSSCIIPGEQQAAVFMKAGIAIPGQRVMRVESVNLIKEWICTFQVANDWYYNALMSCVGDIAYLNKPLMQYRVHLGNETSESEDNMTAVMEHYQIIHKIAKVTTQYGYKKPAKVLPEAINKLGSMCLRYALKMIKTKKFDTAIRYLNLAKVFDTNIESSELFQCLFRVLKNGGDITNEELLKNNSILIRSTSYAPPTGSILL